MPYPYDIALSGLFNIDSGSYFDAVALVFFDIMSFFLIFLPTFAKKKNKI
jgi:hypothetical protein